MAFTFSTESFTRPLADFGNDAAQMTLQTGQMIQQGLQQMMTNRQVSALGAELGTLNPESPEWAQKAIQLGSRYPLAMKSPQGQFLLGTQAKAHADWRQAQRAAAQADLVMKRQVGLENLRTENDIKLEGIRQRNRLEAAGTEMMDLTVPPAMGNRMPTLGTDETQFQNTEDLPGAVQPPRVLPGSGVPLFGEAEDLNALSPGARVRQSLVESGITRIPAKEFRSTVAAERRADAARAMQEDRQRQQEEMATRREQTAEKTRTATEERMGKRMDAATLKTQLATVQRDVDAARRAVTRIITEQAKKDELTEADHAARTQLQAELQALGEERTRLTEELKLVGEAEEQFQTEEEARKAGKKTGDIITLLNPKTGKFQKAKLR
jgi:hypothetical protein